MKHVTRRFAYFACAVNLALGTTLMSLAFSFIPSSASAQDDTSQGYIEEIIVTSKAHPDGINVQDHAVAVSVLTGDYLNESGIKDMFDLQQNAPNLIVGQSQNSTTSNFTIRGIGTSSNNFGLESSVGLYVDGVYRARQSSMINNLVDVEMVQVLRGPQGTLFGKNTPQGAISMRTVKPGHDTNAFVDLTAGDYGLLNVSAATNVSLSEDVLALRATIFSGQRDGYVSDISLGNDVLNDRDRIGGRLQLYYTPNDRFNMRIIADHAEIDEVCCAALTRFDNIVANDRMSSNPDPSAALQEDAGSDFALLSLGGTVFADSAITDPFRAAVIASLPGTVIVRAPDDYRLALNKLPRSSNTDQGLSVEFNYDFETVTLTSISAYRAFDSLDDIDADFSDVDLISKVNDADQSSFSQELRLAGQIGDGGSYVVGAYFFSQDLDNSSMLSSGPLLGTFIGIGMPEIAQLRAGIDAVSAATGGLLPPSGEAFPVGTFANEVMRQEHESWAVFGQVEFELGDQWLLTAGARYTDEEKSMIGTHVQNAQGPPPDEAAILFALCQADPTCGPPLMLPPFDPFDPATQAAFAAYSFDGWGSYSFDPFSPRQDINTTLTDDQLTGIFKLSWFPNDSTMVYVSYGTGYKSGGTNTDRISVLQSTIFGPENSESIELGIKADVTDNLRINLAIYDNQVDDVQALSFTGTGFNVQNAGSADTSGVELEMWWVPIDSFALQLNYVRSNADYDDFILGTCWDVFPFHTGMPDPGTLGPLGTCDHSGGRIAYNPENTLFVAATKDFRLGGSTTLFIRGEYTYASDLFTDGDADPFGLVGSEGIVNLRLGLIFENMDAELTLWGRNITDENYFVSTFDPPVQFGKLNYYTQEPVTYGVTFRKRF